MTRANSRLFRKKVCAALKGHIVVEIDLSQTSSMNFAGLCGLLAIGKMTRGRKGVVRLVNPTPPVQQLLRLVRARQLFEILNNRPTVPGALATSLLPSRLSTFLASDSPRAVWACPQTPPMGEIPHG